MHARVVLGVGKGVLFREVSSVQECVLIEREREVYRDMNINYTRSPISDVSLLIQPCLAIAP